MSSTERRDRPYGSQVAPGRTTTSLIGVTPSMATTNAPTHAHKTTNEQENDQTFADLGVPAILVEALSEAGITTPFPIQSATLPDSLAGRDVLGRGRTGSGKTYAFVLPLLARLAASPSKRRPKQPRALVPPPP